MKDRGDPPKTPARLTMSGRNAQIQASTSQSVSRTPLRPGARVYRDEGGADRTIWQPGDGNGVRDSEFPTKSLFKERYRFFQTEIGPIERGTNSPPHFVVLDDKAVWDIMRSKKYTAEERATFWPFDFGCNGVVRANRRHRGRAALIGGDAKDGDRGHVPWIAIGAKNKPMKYYLAGEDGGYKEVVFNSSTVRPGLTNRSTASTGSRKHESPTKIPTAEATSNLNNGSKTESTTKRKANQPLNPRHSRPKISRYLHRTPSPGWPGGPTRPLNKAPVTGAGADHETHANRHGGSELSPSARVGGKTVYAHYDYGKERPERKKGRLVASNARNSYARTPYPDDAKTPMTGTETPNPGYSYEARTPGLQNPMDESVSSYGASEALPSQQPPDWQAFNSLMEELQQNRAKFARVEEKFAQVDQELQWTRAEREQERRELQQVLAKIAQLEGTCEQTQWKSAQMEGTLLKHDEEILYLMEHERQRSHMPGN